MGGGGAAMAGSPETMKSQLQALQMEDPAQVFIARRINKLGFASSEQLRHYFARFGEVKNVHVSHSRVKSLRPANERRCPNVLWRLRAAALGFVVMSSPEATASIIAAGPEHEVNGVIVRVHPFHRRSTRKDGEDQDFFQEGEYDIEDEEDLNDQDSSMYQDANMGSVTTGTLPSSVQGGLLSPAGSASSGQAPTLAGYPEGPHPNTSAACQGMVGLPGFMYVSERDLQDAMPSQYED
jgi:hypothetical protein